MLIKHKDYNFEVSHIFVFPEQLMKQIYFIILYLCYFFIVFLNT